MASLEGLALSRLEVELLLELLSNTLDLAVVVAAVEQADLRSVLVLGTENTTALEVLVLADGLVADELVDHGRMLDLVVSRNVGVRAGVLVRVLLYHGLDDVVDVVVHRLVDLLATVDDLSRLAASMGHVPLLVVSAHLGEELGILRARGVTLVDVGDGMALLVHELLLLMLLVLDGDGVELDMVLVVVQVTLTEDLLGVVLVASVLGAVSNVVLALSDGAVTGSAESLGVDVGAVTLGGEASIVGLEARRAVRTSLGASSGRDAGASGLSSGAVGCGSLCTG